MEKQFPRTTVGGVSLSRMLMGSNWLLGYSHTSVSADEMIKRRYDSAEKFKPVLETYLKYGVDTLMAVSYTHLDVYKRQAYAFVSRREADPVALRFFAAGYQVFILTYSVGEKAKEFLPLREKLFGLFSYQMCIRDRSIVSFHE